MELIHQLIQRISQARGKQKLIELLQRVKEDHHLRIRTTGTIEELENSLQGVVVDGHLSIAVLARLVDEIEENGAQHVFLFRLTDAGRRRITAQRLEDAFQAPPAGVTSAFYSETPRRHTVFIGDRPGELIVKEIYTGEFWELDEDASEETPTRRVRVTVLRQRRAVNLLRVKPDSGHVEIRVDRLKNSNDRMLALQGLDEFGARLAGVLDFDQHLEPIDLRPAFPRIVAADDETFMLSDHASDASARQSFASRREGPRRGTDIRLHQNWRLGGNTYVRDSLHIYWRLNRDDEMVFSILSVLKRSPDAETEYAKVYFSAKVTPQELDYVVARIRHFAA